jgi:predicted nucleic acid-binding protein
MPGPYTIDASVFLNAFNLGERGSDTSRKLLAQLQSQAVPIIAPTLLLPETAAAIGRGQGNPELARQFAEALSKLPHLVLVPLDLILSQLAVEIAAQHRIRGSDAVYAAVTQRYTCPLITLDQEQRMCLEAMVKTFDPEEAVKIL